MAGQNHIFGSYVAVNALTVITHATQIGGNLVYSGGGGGVSCNVPTSGILAAIGSPPYFDSEDNTVGGYLNIIGLQSCWLGALCAFGVKQPNPAPSGPLEPISVKI